MQHYIILSLKHGSGDQPCFWMPHGLGYTALPFLAGFFTEKEIKANPFHYNDGLNCIAVPLTDEAMARLGFTCRYDDNAVAQFLNKTPSPTP